MDINQFFQSNYLKSSDLQGRRVDTAIEEVKLEKIRDEAKPVCYFEGMEKGLVLNKTNSVMITAIAGTSDTERWSKLEVTLYPTKVSFEGRIVDSIRIEAKLPKAV
jgi:hypothetical protein